MTCTVESNNFPVVIIDKPGNKTIKKYINHLNLKTTVIHGDMNSYSELYVKVETQFSVHCVRCNYIHNAIN